MMKIKKSDLSKMSQYELVAFAKKLQEIEEAEKHRTLETYFETAHKGQIDFHKADKRIRFFFGGNRCLKESSQIVTVDGLKSIGDISASCHYLTYNTQLNQFEFSLGSVPFQKGKENLYRVIHEQGEFVASANHLVFCADGVYRSVLNLFEGQDVLSYSKIEDCFLNAKNSKILRIERQLKSEWYWDLIVPGNNNYCAEGAIHHNSGKTTAGTVEMLWRLLGLHPFIKNKVPIKGALIIQDLENHCKNIIEPKILQWCPSNAIVKTERNQNGAWRKIRFNTGSTLDIFSHDQDIKVFEGSDYDVAWFDEPSPQAIFNAVWRGLTDRGGYCYMTGTPLLDPWTYREVQKAKDGDPLRWFIYIDTEENAVNIGEGDKSLGLKRIEEFASMLNEEEKEARLHGRHVQMHGLIFKEWDKKHHLVPCFVWPKSWPIYESIDPHPQKPYAVSWIGLTENNKKILIRSGLYEGVIEEICQQILYERSQIEIEGGANPRIIRTLIDNAASVPLWSKSNTDPTAKRVSVREEIENIIGPRGGGGPRVEVAPKNVRGKIDIFRQWLYVSETHRGVESDFYCMNTKDNERFIYEIENYVWDIKRGGLLKGLKDQPRKIDDDVLDSIMQVALTLPRDSVESAEVIKTFRGNTWTV